MTHNYTITKGVEDDIDKLSNLYDKLNDYLSETVNYPGWIKGVYPVRETAVNGIKEGNLFICRDNGNIAGTVILNHRPESAYHKAVWLTDAAYSDILVVHTLVINPDYLRKGIGYQLLEFAKQYGREKKYISIRLDVSEKNTPAIELYKKVGFQYIDTVDLELGIPGLKYFQLFEFIL